ncbi:MAG: baseplate J/gp47 family protein [Candidatus Peribacteraceae bacterium]|nr:baseplate J/gp47 family protein [Candidatus Peribacteraceae bacterium]
MALILPDIAKTVIQRIRTDVQGELPNSNPSLKQALITAIIDGYGTRIFDVYYQLKQLVKQLFPFDAVDEFLQFWADIKDLDPEGANAAKGNVTFTGTLGSTIPISTVLTVGTIEYTTDLAIDITAKNFSVDSLTAFGGVATCVLFDDHEFATGVEVVISGVAEDGYNGTHTIEVDGNKSFTFPVDVGVTSPATGTIEVDADTASVGVTADLTTVDQNGIETNQDGGVDLVLQVSIPGVNDTATTQYEGLQGGSNAQTDDEYREDVLYAWQNPLTPFNPNNIESIAKKVDGVTRVFVDEVTPAAGQVTIYHVRDNDESIIPSAAEVQEVRDEILKIKPANTIDEDVITPIIEGVPIDITISDVVPELPSMRTAIEDTIRSYYRGALSKGDDHDPERLRSAIYQTFDVSSAQRLLSFDLDQPTSVEPVSDSQIAIEGNVLINN